MVLTIWWSGRLVAKTPKVCTKGMKPWRASAPAIDIMLASAIPAWMNRSGNASWNRSTSHCRERSPDRHSTSGRAAARSTRARPYGLRTASNGGSSTAGLLQGGVQFGQRGVGQRGRQLDEMAIRVGGQAVQSVD